MRVLLFSFSLGGVCLASATDIDIAKAKGILIWDGEAPEMRDADNFSYSSPNNTQAYEGAWCVEGSPDQWHQAAILLREQSIYRSDLSSYDEIWFLAKASIPGVKLDFSVAGWDYTSNEVDIGPYVSGGTLDTTYKLVKVPISKLQTAQYSLNSIETLYFGTAQPDAGPYKIYVDAVYAVNTTPTHATQAHLLSDKVIKLTVKDRYDVNAVLNLSNYSLTSAQDADFASLRNPTRVGRHYCVSDFAGNGVVPIVSFELFLIFDKPLKNGKTYTLNVNNILDIHGNNFQAPQSVAFSFDDLNLISGSVKANQVGYLPTAPKFGYMGNYLGDAGMMEISPSVFEVRRAADNAVALSGPTRFRGDDLSLSGEKVFDCDFSSLKTPGVYYLYVPGLGRTYNFKIGADTYNDVAQKMSKLYFFQRAGLALDAKYAGLWARGAGHVTTDGQATIHPTHAQSPLYNGEVIGSTLNMPHGWYDAGDFGKYMLTAAPAVFHLFTAYELFPQRFTDNQLNIPETGNGVPDILDELKWEMDWVKEMQASDGGVFDRLVTVQWAETMPEFDLATRYIAPKTTHVTADYAAMLAMAYRNFLPYWPVYASDLLVRAEKAWTFLEAHPDALPPDGATDYVGGGGYVDPSDVPASDVDNRAWAAAELYKSTGKAKYASAFEKYWLQDAPTWGWNEFQHHQKKASWAYASTTKYPINSAYVNSYKSAVKLDADEMVWGTQQNVYRNAYRSDVPEWIGWGAFAQSSRYAWELIRAAYLLQDASYLTSAVINLDTQLGNNPQYKSYITGVGSNYPKDPLHNQSQFDGVVEPVPGIPVYGPHSHLGDENPYNLSAQSTENLYPPGDDPYDAYPLLRRYYDTHELVEMSEFAISDAALDLPAYVFFSSANVAPVAGGQTLTMPVGNAKTIKLSATDADGDSLALTYSVAAAPAHGTLSGVAPNLIYVPNAGFSGTDSFTFKARDGAADSNIATVSITVTGADHTPTISNILNQTTNEDTPTAAIAFTVGDAETAAGSLTLSAASSNPSLVPVANIVLGGSGANRTVTVTPAANQSGTAIVTVTVSDGALTASDPFVVTVTSVDDAPVAKSQSVSTRTSSAVSITLSATDVEADPLTFSIVTGPAHGTLIGIPPALTYRPARRYVGLDSFTFRASAGGLSSNVAVVSIAITQ